MAEEVEEEVEVEVEDEEEYCSDSGSRQGLMDHVLYTERMNIN